MTKKRSKTKTQLGEFVAPVKMIQTGRIKFEPMATGEIGGMQYKYGLAPDTLYPVVEIQTKYGIFTFLVDGQSIVNQCAHTITRGLPNE